jgi:hypothetical protein
MLHSKLDWDREDLTVAAGKRVAIEDPVFTAIPQLHLAYKYSYKSSQ